MKDSMLSALSSAMLVLSLSPLSAVAAQAPKTEPQTVFSPGANPEWSDSHVDSGSEEHVQYHMDADALLNAWKEMHGSEMGTTEYEEALRIELMDRGQSHRAFHGWNVVRVRGAERGGSRTAPTPVPTAAEIIAGSDFNVNLQARTYSGNRPSSRLLAETAHTR